MARDSRRAMVASAVQVLQERGVDGVTLDAVLTRSGAPRGSIYHHFPGGRGQILEEAVDFAGDAITAIIERAAREGSAAILRRFASFWTKLLTESGYEAGCPIVSVAISASGDDAALAMRAGDILARWCDALGEAFVAEGIDRAEAIRLASMSVASLEGAVMLCRARRTLQPLQDVAVELELLIDGQKLLARNAHRLGRQPEPRGAGLP